MTMFGLGVSVLFGVHFCRLLSIVVIQANI